MISWLWHRSILSDYMIQHNLRFGKKVLKLFWANLWNASLYMRFGLMCSYNTENYNCFFYLWSVKPLWKVKLLGQWLNFRSVESSWASVVNRSKWKTICLHTFQRADLEGVRRFLWKPRLNEKKENNITPWLGLYLKPLL